MSDMNAPAGDCIFGSALRSNAALNDAGGHLAAVRELREGALTVKSYVLPLFETFGKPAAASGTSWLVRGPMPSG